MKKILLATVFLLTLCVGVSRADIIRPGETPWWEGLDKLSTEEKLAQCKELKRWHPDIHDLLDVMPPKKKWDMLDCDKLLKKHAGTQAAANPEETAPDAAPVTDTDDQTNPFTSYVISGLLAVVLCVFACILLWRARELSAQRVL